MWKHSLSCSALVTALGLSGCGGGSGDQPDGDAAPQGPPTPPAVDKPDTGLGEQTDISLADWLKLSRPELAKKVRELKTLALAQQQSARDDRNQLWALLPQLYPPLLLPVIQDSTWNEALGISVPTWLAPGAKDAELALHLARHGDVDAALKVAPDDAALRQKLEAMRTGPNIPFEWSQLVGVQMYMAQIRMKQGEAEGATELVLLHRQLASILPPQVAQGPLGTALLPLGRHALGEACRAWHSPGNSRPILAGDIDKAMPEWTDRPVMTLPHLTRDAAGPRWLGVPAKGQTVIFPKGPVANRALDLLALPIVAEGVDSIVAVLGSQDQNRVAEVLFVYGPKVSSLYPQIPALAYELTERGIETKPVSSPSAAGAWAFRGVGAEGDLVLLPRNHGFGALVRMREPGAKIAVTLPRDFGAVHLDGSFENNRLHIDPSLATDRPSLSVTRPEALARITSPTPDPLVQAVLQRDKEARLLANLSLIWPAAVNDESISHLLIPLIGAWGVPQLEQVDDEQIGAFLALVWSDSQTRIALRLPYGSARPELRASNSDGGDPKTRLEAARTFDLAEREARWQAGTPSARLPRSWALESVVLGQDKDTILKSLENLPPDRYVRFPVNDGLGILLPDTTPGKGNWSPRQVIVRFGPGNKAAEIRVCCEEIRVKSSPGNPSLLDTLLGQAGSGEKRPAPWQGLWGDLSPQGNAVLYAWADDQTAMTYQRDAGGSELTLIDCPRNLADGIVLPPVEYVSRGVPGAQLGDRRSDVLAAFKVTKPQVLNDGGVFLPGTGTPYAQLIVYFEPGVDGKVTRVLARHYVLRPQDVRPANDTRPVLTGGADNSQVLGPYMAANIKHLGLVRRVDPLSDRGEQGWAWHDDKTRARLFTWNLPDGLALMSEWRTWPVAVTWSGPATPVKPLDRAPPPTNPQDKPTPKPKHPPG